MIIDLHTLLLGEPHACGYPTCGDWKFGRDPDGGMILTCTVSPLDDKDSEMAVLLHELIEAWFCRRNGISEKQVSEFDQQFETEREDGKHSDVAEPGDDERAPYRSEHQAATLMELQFLTLLNKPWPEHCGIVAKV